jgi:activator of HSP90 ATPase
VLRPIKQHVVLPAPAAELFAAYLNPETHAAITGAPVIIGRNPGDCFEAFNGQLSGHMIDVAEPRLIVQAWRSAIFYDTDPDSTLVLAFSDTEEGGRIDLIHTGVPEHDHDGVTEGWPKFYWDPWRRYLEQHK